MFFSFYSYSNHIYGFTLFFQIIPQKIRKESKCNWNFMNVFPFNFYVRHFEKRHTKSVYIYIYYPKLLVWKRRSLNIPFSRFVFVNLSIIVNLACWLNLWPFFWNCSSANIAVGSFTSFLWLFNLMLNGASFLPIQCRLHVMHSIR